MQSFRKANALALPAIPIILSFGLHMAAFSAVTIMPAKVLPAIATNTIRLQFSPKKPMDSPSELTEPNNSVPIKPKVQTRPPIRKNIVKTVSLKKVAPTEIPEQLDVSELTPSFSEDAAPSPNSSTSAETPKTAAKTTTLARPAKMIRASFVKPNYTRAALQADYQDTIVASVLVDSHGQVKEVKLNKNAPYGMHQKIIGALKSTKFSPEYDHYGYPKEAWTEVKFFMSIR